MGRGSGGGSLKRAIIHIGMPKTGTTAIQTALVNYADALRNHGLRHPGSRDFNHPALVSRFHPNAANHWYLKQMGIDEAEGGRLFDEFWSDVTSSDGDVILSCEYLFDLAAGAPAMAATFENAGFDPLFVCYVRHPVDAATSASQQAVKIGARPLADALWKPRWLSPLGTLTALLDAGRNVIVRDYSDAKKAGAVHDLLAAVGRTDAADAIPNETVNASLTMDGAILADIHTRYQKTYGRIPFPRQLIFEVGSTRFALPEKAKNMVRETCGEELRFISENFGIELEEEATDARPFQKLSPEAVIALLRALNGTPPEVEPAEAGSAVD